MSRHLSLLKNNVNNENVRAIRPGLGLPTKYLPQTINRVAKQDLKRLTALS